MEDHSVSGDSDVIVEPAEIIANILADPTDIFVDDLSVASEEFGRVPEATQGDQDEEQSNGNLSSDSQLADFSESSLEESEFFHYDVPEIQSFKSSENMPQHPEDTIQTDDSSKTLDTESISLDEAILPLQEEINVEAESPLEQTSVEIESTAAPIVESHQQVSESVIAPPPYTAIPEDFITQSLPLADRSIAINQVDDMPAHLYPTEAMFDLKKDDPLPAVTDAEEEKPVAEETFEDTTAERPYKRLYVILAVLIVVAVVIAVVFGKSYFSDPSNKSPKIPPNNVKPPGSPSPSSSETLPIAAEASTLLGKTFAYLKKSIFAKIVGFVFLLTLAFSIGFYIYMAFLKANLVPVLTVPGNLV